MLARSAEAAWARATFIPATGPPRTRGGASERLTGLNPIREALARPAARAAAARRSRRRDASGPRSSSPRARGRSGSACARSPTARQTGSPPRVWCSRRGRCPSSGSRSWSCGSRAPRPAHARRARRRRRPAEPRRDRPSCRGGRGGGPDPDPPPRPAALGGGLARERGCDRVAAGRARTQPGAGLDALQGEGFWILGADARGDRLRSTSCPTGSPGGPGGRVRRGGSGLRPGVAKRIDRILRIPLRGRVASLNVSTAAVGRALRARAAVGRTR